MSLAQFVAFHAVAEPTGQCSPAPAFAVMIARSASGVVLVFSRYRQVWELPGGLIDAGETARRAAERELVEESGCVARNTRWLGMVEVNDGRPHIGAVFCCEVDAVPDRFENAETEAIVIWQRDSPPHPLGASDEALLAKFA